MRDFATSKLLWLENFTYFTSVLKIIDCVGYFLFLKTIDIGNYKRGGVESCCVHYMLRTQQAKVR